MTCGKSDITKSGIVLKSTRRRRIGAGAGPAHPGPLRAGRHFRSVPRATSIVAKTATTMPSRGRRRGSIILQGAGGGRKPTPSIDGNPCSAPAPLSPRTRPVAGFLLIPDAKSTTWRGSHFCAYVGNLREEALWKQRGSVIASESTSWRVGRVEIPHQ